MTDGLDTIAKVTGLSRSDMDDILAQVRANHAQLAACALHRYAPDSYKFGQKMICLKCGGTMQATDVGHYIKGYEAAGGKADDIWPGYHARKAD